MSRSQASVTGIDVDGQSWLVHVNQSTGRLAYYHSVTPDESQKEAYDGPQDIKIGRDAIRPDQGAPIAATSFSSSKGTEVRLFFFQDLYIRELMWNSTDQKWVYGALTDKDIEASQESGLSAKQLNGYLKVYFQNSRHKFTVWYTPINQNQWDTNSVQK